MPDENTLFQWWLKFFELSIPSKGNSYHALINSIADVYPDKRSMLIDYMDIFENNSDLGEEILSNPYKVIMAGESAIASLLSPDQKVGINLRIYNLFEANSFHVRELRASHLNKLVTIKGTITRVTGVKNLLLFGVFKCNSCGMKQEITQDSFSFTEPLECPKDDGGCGKRAGSTSFKFIIGESLFIDRQKIEIEEGREHLKPNEQPQRIVAYLEDDMTGQPILREKAKVTGIIRAKNIKEGNAPSTLFDVYMKANHIEVLNPIDYEITDELEKEFKMMIKNNPFEQIMDSICPSLKLPRLLKETITVQLFGSVGKFLSDGTWNRGELNILLLGEPGTGKSKLGEWMTRARYHGVSFVGTTGSQAGLGAGVDKSDFGEGRYVIEPGAMIKANGGHITIDEIADLQKEDIDALKEGMEDNKYTLSKIVKGTFDCRESFLLITNPKGGLFREGAAMIEQIPIKFSSALRSRCDLILYYKDIVDKKKDKIIANHIQKQKRGLPEDIVVKLPLEKLRSFVEWTRRYEPYRSDEVIEYLSDEYAELRQLTWDMGLQSRSITNRQINTLMIISDSYARAEQRLVTKEDVDRAITLFKETTKEITGGDLDVIAIETGRTQHTRIIAEEIAIILSRKECTEEEIVKELYDPDVDENTLRIRDTINIMKNQKEGRIFEKPNGKLTI